MGARMQHTDHALSLSRCMLTFRVPANFEDKYANLRCKAQESVTPPFCVSKRTCGVEARMINKFLSAYKSSQLPSDEEMTYSLSVIRRTRFDLPPS